MVRPQLRALTGLRGIAAWLVVLYHVRTACLPSIGPTAFAILAKGYLAVDLFFLLSGFVLWLNYAERLRAGGGSEAGRFMMRRIGRLWPLHGLVLAFTLGIALALRGTGRDASGYPWATLPLHALLIQNWGFTRALDWNVPDWSISTELAASLLFPLIAFAHWDARRTPLLLGALALLLALLVTLFAAQGSVSLGFDISRLGLPRCLLEFTAGTILCALWRRWRGVRHAAPLALGLAALLLGGAAAGLAPETLPETLLVPAGFAALLIGIAIADARNPLGAALPHALGEWSYATYLVHFPLFFAFKLAFVRDAWDVPLWQIGLFLAGLLAVSAALHRLVELPAQHAIARAARRPSPVPARLLDA